MIVIFKKSPYAKNFKELIQGKTIARESAGAYVLSNYFYSKSINKTLEGLKLVPIKIICHYNGKNKEKLDNYSNDLETLPLKDYEYKVFKL